MDKAESLCHTKWDCKYHVVFIPKCRRKVLYDSLRRCLGEVFRKLAAQKESRIEEGAFDAGTRAHDDGDSTQVCRSQVVGFIKGRSAIHVARV